MSSQARCRLSESISGPSCGQTSDGPQHKADPTARTVLLRGKPPRGLAISAARKWQGVLRRCFCFFQGLEFSKFNPKTALKPGHRVEAMLCRAVKLNQGPKFVIHKETGERNI